MRITCPHLSHPLLALVALGGCNESDYGLAGENPKDGVDPGETGETGNGPDEPKPQTGDCFTLNQPVLVLSGNNGWDPAALSCVFLGTGDDGNEIVFGNWVQRLAGYTVGGVGGTSRQLGAGTMPDPSIPFRFGFFEDGATNADWEYDDTKFYAGIDLHADPATDGATGNWLVADAPTRAAGRLGAGVDELDDCCGCDWRPYVEIADPEVAITPYYESDCRDKYADVLWCPVWDRESDCREDRTAARRGASKLRSGRAGSAACTPGTGRFLLVPVASARSGRRAEHATTLWPLQVGGTTPMTGNAVIRALRAPTGAGRLFQRDAPAPGGPGAGRAAAWLEGARQLSPGEHRFGAGVRGDALRLVRVSDTPANWGDLTAELEWTCEAGDEPAVDAPAGREAAPGVRPAKGTPARPGDAQDAPAERAATYRFRLADLGCPVDWPQRFFLRTDPVGSSLARGMAAALQPRAGSAAVEIWPEGAAPTRRVVLRPNPDFAGLDFNESQSGLTVRGTLLAFDEAAARLQLHEVSLNGVPLCAPGTFTIAAEQP